MGDCAIYGSAVSRNRGRPQTSVGVPKMNANPRKTRFAYAMMLGFMALSTAALAAASASGGNNSVVSVVSDTDTPGSTVRDAG